MKNNRIFLIVILVIFNLKIDAQSFENGFNFNLPFNDTTTADFLPQFPNKAITNEDFVSTDSLGNFIVKGEPYRFYGGNLTTQAAFPTKADAELIAGRMRKFGINLVRFHHIDNPWSDGSLFHNINGTRSFNTVLLDRLDYFIFQLKQNGIYVNMNLNVSRTFEDVDGVIDADSLSDYGKGITQFDSTMITLQKEYAEKLLAHTNPYTGMALAEDPVLAMVEIINENSLFRMWYGDDLKPIEDGGKLPIFYYKQFEDLWYNYLTEKYDSTSAIADAWNNSLLIGDTIYSDGFEDGLSPVWNLELHETSVATAQISSDAATGNSAVKINLTALSSETWHTQFKYFGGTIKKDSIYEIYFKAKADSPKSININLQRDNSPWTYYAGMELALDTVYKEFKVSFLAPEDNTNNLRVSFSFQHNLGEFYFDDFIFKHESKLGLDEGESLEDRNISRISVNDFLGYSEPRIMDLTEFYADIEIKFLQEMKVFLRDSLEVVAPLTGTNWFTGPEEVYVQNTLDYIDNHSYWDHPSFPVTPWSPTEWTINNKPMMTSNSGTIENLFNGLIVKGKPYTVSEYNHAFPNQYQSELLPIITSYLSFNDADGFMIFTYSGSWNWSENKVSGFFDIHRNSSLMGSFPLFSYAFRNNLINSDANGIEINYSKSDVLKMPTTIVNWWSTHYPYDKILAYTHKVEINFDSDQDFNPDILPEVAQSPYSFNNGQLYWDKTGLFKINTNQFTSISGFLNNFPGASTDMMTLVSGSDFGSVNWLSLVDSALDVSSKSILSIGTKMMNTNMLWDGLSTVHNNWGIAPALVYPLSLELKLKSEYPNLRVYPVNELGNSIDGNSYQFDADENGYVNISLNQVNDKTLWYGIKGFTSQDTIINEDTTNTSTKVFKDENLSVFPNPVIDYIQFEFNNLSTPALLKIIDLSGRIIYESKLEDNIIIRTSDFQPGTYFYIIRTEKKVFTGKIIKT